MSESLLQSKLIKDLYSIDAIPVDNPRHSGTADINYVEGWLELKWLSQWPSRKQTVVKIPSISPQQRVVWTKRSMAGGNIFVLLQVGFVRDRSEYLLFEAGGAAEYLGKLNREDLYKECLASWSEYPGKGIIKWIVK